MYLISQMYSGKQNLCSLMISCKKQMMACVRRGPDGE